MKLTELILELHTIMLEKGNLDVMLWDEQGWAEPSPKYGEFSKWVELN
jgi:hypothetical protein